MGIILLHAVHDCPDGRTAAIARHVSFAQITCFYSAGIVLLTFNDLAISGKRICGKTAITDKVKCITFLQT